MGKSIINTGTVTYALRGRDLLRAKGYSAYMFRTTGKSTVGCGYSISTSADSKTVEKIFISEGIKYISIEQGDGV